MPRSSIRLVLNPALLLVVALVVGTATPGRAESELPGPVPLRLSSGYLAAAVLGGHQIKLVASLPGEGQLIVDPNRCSLDAFGDPAACTRMAARPLPVRLVAKDTADPANRGRRLYAVQVSRGNLGAASITLVRPADGNRGWRLIVTPHGEGGPSVIPMQLQHTPKPRVVPGTPCRFGGVTYLATYADGSLTLVAEGHAPTPGYTLTFEVAQEPRTYRFLCKPPSGIVTQVLVPFRKMQSFDLAASVEEVIVVDGHGRHKVRVAPLR